MANKKEVAKKEILFPYYVNQGRMLDIYSILNGGYSEYSEITTEITNNVKTANKAEITASIGFKIFNFGGNVSSNDDNINTELVGNKEKRVQTVTSVLSIVKTYLSDNGYLKDIKQAQAGDFVCIPVVLTINSIKSLLSEMNDLMGLSNNMQKINHTDKSNSKDAKSIDKEIKTIKELFDGEEILYQENDYAIIGTITDNNLYQAVREDLVGTNLKCLAQVKRIYPNGTNLMKNTIFTRIKSDEAKKTFIDAINKISNSDLFEFEAIAVPSIKNKPVYQLEIIALYQCNSLSK